MWRSRVSRWAPIVIIVAASILYVVVSVLRRSLELSPYDEGTYFDYLFAIPEDPIRQTGEPFTLEARQLFSCIGTIFIGPTGVACGGNYNDLLAYQQQGLTSADAYTPVYFWLLWLLVQPLTWFGIDFLTATRFLGVIWLIPSALFMYAIMKQLKVNTWLATSLILLFIATPLSYWSFTFVSTDAPMIMFAAISIWLVIRAIEGKSSYWWFVPLAAVAQLFKVTAVMGTLLAALVAGVAWIVEWKLRNTSSPDGPTRTHIQSLRKWMLPFAAAGAALGAVQIGWTMVRSAIAVASPPDQGIGLVFGLKGDLIRTVQLFFTSTVDSHPRFAKPFGYAVVDLYTDLVMFLIAAGVLAAFFRRSRNTVESGLSTATLIATFTFGPILLIALIAIGEPFTLPERYGAFLVPAFFALTGLAIENRLAKWLIGCLAVAGYLYIVTIGPIMY